MYGIDISNHNREFLKTNYGKHLFSTADFIFMKATEGKKFTDKSVVDYAKRVMLNGTKIIGFYHYARPDLNEWFPEAHHFCDVVSRILKDVHNCTVLLALDWEGLSLTYSTKWAFEWLNYVEYVLKVKPLAYMSESVAQSSEWDSIVDNDFGLWVAKWSDAVPDPGRWPFYAIHQYASSPCDLDVFNGTQKQLEAYGLKV